MRFISEKLTIIKIVSFCFLVVSCSLKPSQKKKSGDNDSLGTGNDKELSAETSDLSEGLIDMSGPKIGSKSLYLLPIKYVSNTLAHISDGFINKPDLEKVHENTYSKHFDNQRANILTLSQFSNYWDASNVIAEKLISNESPLADVKNCKPTSATDPCIAEIISKYGKALFRRELTKEEVSYYSGIAASAGEEYIESGVKYILVALLNAPDFLYQKFYGDGSNHLTDQELISRIAFFLF